ncbi:MAG: type III pantothenate kinase [Ruminiclostridium sp.]|nr:type III pantothenate kinase [Ruminiclostridium sp.]
MLLAIDVGNTSIQFGLLEGEKLLGTFRQSSDPTRTAEDLEAAIRRDLEALGVQPDRIEAAIIDSVVPPVMEALTAAVEKVAGVQSLVVEADIKTGIGYPVGSSKLGPDRAVCCVAAIEKYGKPVIVLDFGTATTVDAVGADGSYLGGCILAGVMTSANALFTNTAMLPKIDLVLPPTVLGGSTVAQLQVGAVMGAIGSTEYLVRRTRKEMGCGEDVTVVATGGLGRLVAEGTDCIDVVDDDLVMEGLRVLYARYRETQK